MCTIADLSPSMFMAWRLLSYKRLLTPLQRLLLLRLSKPVLLIFLCYHKSCLLTYLYVITLPHSAVYNNSTELPGCYSFIREPSPRGGGNGREGEGERLVCVSFLNSLTTPVRSIPETFQGCSRHDLSYFGIQTRTLNFGHLFSKQYFFILPLQRVRNLLRV